MKPTINLVRAVGVEFAKRALKPLVIIVALAAAVLLSIGGWLTTVNAWWWLLEAVLIGATLIFTVLAATAFIILRIIGPVLTKTQKPAVVGFVDKLERVAENVKTPYPVIIFYVLRDIARPRPDGFIETISQDSKTLAPDLAKLRKLFG